MKVARIASCPISIFIAGHYDAALAACQEFCDDHGLCVTVTPTEYVYTNGRESGVIVGLINYPRFPSNQSDLEATAVKLAEYLLVNLVQLSFTIQTPKHTTWYSNRPEDNQNGS
jgi:nitrate reductase beta subunit